MKDTDRMIKNKEKVKSKINEIKMSWERKTVQKMEVNAAKTEHIATSGLPGNQCKKGNTKCCSALIL